MYAIIDYKGQQILVEEGKKIKFPYLKDLKPGSTIEFDQVLYLFDGDKKKIGSPFIKGFSIKGKIDSHMKDPKVIVFKKKRRKGYQKKNGHKQPYTLLQVDKLNIKKTRKAASSTKAKAATNKKNTTKKTVSKKTATKKTAAKKTATKKED